MIQLSVLDQTIAAAGASQDQAVRNTLALAQQCEAWGYRRFWVSEHHSHPSIVGTAPEILMAAIAARTQRIRIGSAGVMLPHYSALKVAEQFRVLNALAPGASIWAWAAHRAATAGPPKCSTPIATPQSVSRSR